MPAVEIFLAVRSWEFFRSLQSRAQPLGLVHSKAFQVDVGPRVLLHNCSQGTTWVRKYRLATYMSKLPTKSLVVGWKTHHSKGSSLNFDLSTQQSLSLCH
jgi:hypothetical protein